jgi:hypothetical protein
MDPRVLARRARFMGTVMALAGCGNSPSSGSGAPPSVPVIEPGDAGPQTPIATFPEQDAGPREERFEFLVPEGISEETRTRYVRLKDSVQNTRKEITRVRGQLKSAPTCPSASCDTWWRDMAGTLQSLQQRTGWLGYHCPKKREETDRFLERVEKERKDLQERVGRVRSEALSLLGPNADQRLAQYEHEYDAAHPRPCLSIACDSW